MRGDVQARGAGQARDRTGAPLWRRSRGRARLDRRCAEPRRQRLQRTLQGRHLDRGDAGRYRQIREVRGRTGRRRPPGPRTA